LPKFFILAHYSLWLKYFSSLKHWGWIGFSERPGTHHQAGLGAKHWEDFWKYIAGLVMPRNHAGYWLKKKKPSTERKAQLRVVD
jgi:hypothetical protein